MWRNLLTGPLMNQSGFRGQAASASHDDNLTPSLKQIKHTSETLLQ